MTHSRQYVGIKTVLFILFLLIVSESFGDTPYQSPSPLIPVSNRPWLERPEDNDVVEFMYSEAPSDFDEKKFYFFFHTPSTPKVIYGFNFASRKEDSEVKRYQFYSGNLAITDLLIGELTLDYLNYPEVQDRKSSVIAIQLSKKIINTIDKQLKLFIRPVYAANQGFTEEHIIGRQNESLLLLGGDYKGQHWRLSTFATLASFPNREEPLKIQTELIDLTNIDGLENVSSLAHYMFGAHIGYGVEEKWGINFTYANLWENGAGTALSLYPTISYHLNKVLSFRLAFQRVVGGVLGTRNYGTASVTFGQEMYYEDVL